MLCKTYNQHFPDSIPEDEKPVYIKAQQVRSKLTPNDGWAVLPRFAKYSPRVPMADNGKCRSSDWPSGPRVIAVVSDRTDGLRGHVVTASCQPLRMAGLAPRVTGCHVRFPRKENPRSVPGARGLTHPRVTTCHVRGFARQTVKWVVGICVSAAQLLFPSALTDFEHLAAGPGSGSLRAL